MKEETREIVSQFWADSLGCERKTLKDPGNGVYVRNVQTDYNSDHGERDVDIFFRKNQILVSCSKEVESRIAGLENLGELGISEPGLEKAGLDIEELLGPAFLAYADESIFEPVSSRNVRRLTLEDEPDLEVLRQKADSVEIDDSIADKAPEKDILFGKFVDGDLVAVSDYEVWDRKIAFISVFVAEDCRGNGFGKEVVSRASEDALENGLIPSYRTLEKWPASVNLATSLGFEKYATTYLVKLKEK